MKTFLCAVALLVVALPTAAQVGGAARSKQIVISHRGASAYAPEHTFFAYDLAMRQDTDMLECDLILTKDEVPVCIHDETVDRTSDGTGRVDSFTLAEMRAFDFGSWFNTSNPTQADPSFVGAKIVPFEEQLDCYLRHNPKMRFHVETKDSAGGRAEQVMHDLLTRKGLIATGNVAAGPRDNVESSTVILQSFDAGSLERMRSLNDTIPTGFLFSAPTSLDILQWLAAGTGPDYIDFFIPNSAVLLTDVSAVQRFHLNGHDVHTWTVNDSQQMNLLLGQGVDGLFTNNSDLLRAAIDEQGTGFSAEERGNPADFMSGCPGIAGRVTSNQGPGDVWEPTGTRGVRLKSGTAAPTPPDGHPPVVIGGSPTSGAMPTGRLGGGALGGLLLGLLGLAGTRRLLSRRRPQ
jgi:glycerophosphoryl diester phosphodiesterase